MSYQEEYQQKLTTAEKAVECVDSGMWLDYGWSVCTPVALDKACVDLVYASPDPGKSHLIERMESRHGIHTLEHAEAIGLGSQQYRLVELK